MSGIKNEDIKVRQDSMSQLLTDVQLMKGKQESMDSKLIAMKQYVDGGGHMLWIGEVSLPLCSSALSWQVPAEPSAPKELKYS